MTSTAKAQSNSIPRHVAIIMDGNGRWATSRSLPRSAGHVAGADAATRAYRAARVAGIEQLTLYAFSCDNYKRPAAEVAVIMGLFAEYARMQRDDFIERGIRLEIIGDLDDVPAATRRSLEETMAATASQREMVLSLAIAYSARRDLVEAVRALCVRVHAGLLLPEEVDETALRRWMWTHRLVDVDLLIRTGGEQRLSDFLLFESAYGELFFDEVMWPDFGASDLRRALHSYARRQRRFGAVSAAEAAPVPPVSRASAVASASALTSAPSESIELAVSTGAAESIESAVSIESTESAEQAA